MPTKLNRLRLLCLTIQHTVCNWTKKEVFQLVAQFFSFACLFVLLLSLFILSLYCGVNSRTFSINILQETLTNTLPKTKYELLCLLEYDRLMYVLIHLNFCKMTCLTKYARTWYFRHFGTSFHRALSRLHFLTFSHLLPSIVVSKDI